MLPSNLLHKLTQVQEELTSSFRTIVLSETTSPFSVPAKLEKHFDGIRLDAGADLLNHYQFQWCRIRESSDHNYRLAQQADKAIHALEDYINHQHTLVCSLTKSSIASISIMTSQLEKLSESLVTTERIIQDTERQLVILGELVKDGHLEAHIKEQDKKFASIENQKLAELEKLKCHLEGEYQMKIKEHEVKQMLKAKERQAIFEAAFESEIEQYKQSGIIPKLRTAHCTTSSLEEIEVEDDPSSLNNFLDE